MTDQVGLEGVIKVLKRDPFPKSCCCQIDEKVFLSLLPRSLKRVGAIMVQE